MCAPYALAGADTHLRGGHTGRTPISGADTQVRPYGRDDVVRPHDWDGGLPLQAASP